ncbi:hypothetical protein VCHA53O466_320002 [Vibrio chagasii]|nr:hypothetical protein VCHA53O466_320002 [Vibrio chagasii]
MNTLNQDDFVKLLTDGNILTPNNTLNFSISDKYRGEVNTDEQCGEIAFYVHRTDFESRRPDASAHMTISFGDDNENQSADCHVRHNSDLGLSYGHPKTLEQIKEMRRLEKETYDIRMLLIAFDEHMLNIQEQAIEKHVEVHVKPFLAQREEQRIKRQARIDHVEKEKENFDPLTTEDAQQIIQQMKADANDKGESEIVELQIFKVDLSYIITIRAKRSDKSGDIEWWQLKNNNNWVETTGARVAATTLRSWKPKAKEVI